ncbi:hypothetical protein N9L43_00265 [bacterium]|nr:hypothetical protein [bacterium]
MVHPDFIPELGSEKLKFGLAVSFVFDQKISEEIQRHKKFMNSTHFSKFKRYEKGGEVLCYGVDMHLDYDATATLLEQILIEFFDFDASTEFESHLMDLGLLR